MHIVGRILLGLCILLAGTAAYFSAELLSRRNTWMKTVEAKRKAYEEAVPKLPKVKAKLWELQREEHRLVFDQGQVWTDLQATAGQTGPGSVVLAGIDATTGQKPEQVLHLFQPLPLADGQIGTRYVGPFRVKIQADGRTGLSPDWIVSQTDLASWQLGPGWRARTQINASDTANFIRNQVELLLQDTYLLNVTKDRDLAQTTDRKFAEDHLAYRINELHGDLALMDKKGQLPNYLVDGLVQAIEDQEEIRNAEVLAVDELRHRLKGIFDDVKRLQERNAKLVGTLPGAEPAPSPTTSPDSNDTTAG